MPEISQNLIAQLVCFSFVPLLVHVIGQINLKIYAVYDFIASHRMKQMTNIGFVFKNIAGKKFYSRITELFDQIYLENLDPEQLKTKLLSYLKLHLCFPWN